MMGYGGTRPGKIDNVFITNGKLGGFLEDSGSQSLNSPAKSRFLAQSLRPVTIKQLLEAQLSQGNDSFKIIGNKEEVELGQIQFVACVRSLRESNTGADYVFEDGTGSISGKCWQDKAGLPVSSGVWARVYGSLRSMKDSRSVNIFSIKPVQDHNEITLHFLQVLSLTANPAQKSTPVLINDYLNPLQKAVLNVYAATNAPQGLHFESVIRALSNNHSQSDIRDTISWLITEGYIFETHDPDHAKLVNAQSY